MKISTRFVMGNIRKTSSRIESRFDKAQKALDSQVLKDCTPYVPMRDGDLMRSGINDTTYGSGKVIWNAPHAKRMYYGLSFNFSPMKHPQACAQWFEKAKAVCKKAWLALANKAVKE